MKALRRRRFIGAIAIACAVVSIGVMPRSAAAIIIGGLSDEILAEHPVIVVGRWNRAPVRVHDKIEGNVSRAHEFHTQLVVEEVVVGDLKPGTHPIILNAFVGWEKEDGGPMISTASSYQRGDVDDVKDSNLWFLTLERSWDETDPKKYLTVENHRSAQPLVLKDYFRALMSQNPREEVPKLLSADNPIVVHRVLEYLCDFDLPWPYQRYVPPANTIFADVEEAKPEPEVNPFRRYAPEVEKLLVSKQPEVRRLAAALFGNLADKDAVPRMRALLDDADDEVRAVAAGWLVRKNATDGGDELVRALRGAKPPSVACKVIDALAEWEAEPAVPALIEFLENDGSAYISDDDYGIPALAAQKALLRKTGHAFLFDVEASRRAWNEVKAIPDKEGRLKRLAEIMPFQEDPFTCTVAQSGGKSVFVLTNQSKQTVTIAKQPDSITFRAFSEVLSYGLRAELHQFVGQNEGRKAADYIRLAPSESHRFDGRDGLPILVPVRECTLDYLTCGGNVGVKAWIGTVAVAAAKE